MLTFIGAALIIIMIPGPDQALITRYSLAGGRTAGLLTMLGGMSGLTVHATAAAAGVSVLLLSSTIAFTTLKILGVVYLAWLGVQTIRTARSKTAQSTATAENPAGHTLRYLRNGFLSNALNPKVALFFVTFLPQFLPPAGAVFGQAMLYSAVFALLYVGWFSLYILAVDRLAAFLGRPGVRSRIEGFTGVLLIGFALRLALQQSG